MAQTKDQSDVAALWDEALNAYSDTSKINIRSILSSRTNIAAILTQQQHELDTFSQFRHNKGKLDKLRSLIASNSDYIQAAAKQIANAASTAFPPSSAILTAFTYVLTASKHVSDDFNVIESFFDVMQCFLRRLSLLEGKIPPRKEFHQDLIKVFSSILAISGVAYSYCLKGRFRHWASALVEGSDPKLKSAYDGLHENLKRLESATMIQTLRVAIDVHDETKTIKEDVRALHASFDRNTALTEEILRIVRKQPHDAAGQQRQLKSRASRPANFARLRVLLNTATVETAVRDRMQELKQQTLPRVFDWVENEPALVDLVNHTESLFWVSGAPGMGKSTMAFKIFQHLKETFASDEVVRVAYFFFDSESPNMRSVKNMIKWCAVQVAEVDVRYCESILRNLRDEPYKRGTGVEDIEKEWDKLIGFNYTVESGKRLILVLDGIDEAEGVQIKELLNIIRRVKESKGREIQVILTSDVNYGAELAPLVIKSMELTKVKITGDMHRFASSQAKNLPRLQKLRPNFCKFLVRKVVASADSFVYITHMMQRLNGIGYEAPLRRELDRLPATTAALYDVLLSDCQRNRSPADREVVRHLLSWLAYAKSKLSVGEAVLLINIIEKENSVSIDEAFDGPLGRLLRISSSGAGGDQESNHSESESESNDPDSGEDFEIEVNVTEEATTFVKFQERSLRAFFRQAIDDPHGLRCNSTEARVIVFKVISTILGLESEYHGMALLDPPEKSSLALMRQAGLKQYAAEWTFAHFLEIDINKVNDEMAGVVLKCLFNILSNKNKSLMIMELYAGPSVLHGKEADEDEVLAAIGSWAKLSVSLSPEYLSIDIKEFFRPIASEPRCVFLVLARSHVNNWFTSEGIGTAVGAFECSHYSLMKSKDLPELNKNRVLKDYLQRFDRNITTESLAVVFNAFEDIVKTPASYLGIARVMNAINLCDEAVKQCDVGLGLDVKFSDNDRLWLLWCRGETLCRAGSLSYDENESSQYFRQAFESLGSAFEVFFKLERESALTDLARTTIAFAFADRAHSAVMVGEFDYALESVKQAAKYSFWDNDIYSLKGIVVALAKVNQYQKVIEVLEAIPMSDLAKFFLQVDSKTQDAFQEAAQRSGRGHCLLDLYSAACKRLATDTPMAAAHSFSIPDLHIAAALFARQVLNDTASAKSLLSEIVYSAQASYDMVELAAYLLAETLFEDFRLSANPHTKSSVLRETRALLAHLTEIIGASFHSDESSISVILGVMLKTMGPALDRADLLRGAFSACVERLTDDIGYNDMMTMRHLSRILVCVTGLEREAQIAMTGQLYVLDREVREKELAEQRQQSEEADMGTVSASTEINQSSDTEVVDDMAEGIIAERTLWCNGCGKIINDWAQGDVYMCVYCTNCDLCGECFAKKVDNDKGVTTPNWRVICPSGHRHVKAPVEGWRGVRDGVLRIGEEEILFRDWLKDLEVKWNAYWGRYWATSVE